MTRAEDYNEIKSNFQKFTEAWSSGNMDLIDEAVKGDAKSYFSIFGSERPLSRIALKENLAIRTHKTTYARIDINNYVCLIEGNHAQQIAYLNGLWSDDSDGKYEHYCWSGQMANHWVKTSDGWRMDELRFDQNLDDYHMLGRGDDLGFILLDGPGNIEFQSNWLGIQDRVGWFQGCRLPAISAEFDAPWFVIKNPENIGTDEEQLQEMFAKYCFAIDNDCFVLFKDVFSEYLSASIFWGTQDRRQITQTLKINRSGSRRCQHTGKMGKCVIDGDTAYYTVYNKSPVTFTPFSLTKETEEESKNWCMNRWMCTAKKENGQWRIVRFHTGSGPLVESEIYD